MITNTELAILGLVAEQPKYGYQIESEVTQRGMRNWTEIGFSSIYYVLNKMENAGWLSSSKQNQGDRPTRKIYQVTPSGQQTYHQAVLDRFSRPRPRSGDYMLALANLPVLSKKEIAVGLETYRGILKSMVSGLQEKWELDQSNSMPQHVNFLFDYSITQLQAELMWVENLIQSQKGNVSDVEN